MTAYGQDTRKCLSKAEIDIDNLAYQDAFAYRIAYDSTASACEDLKQVVSNLEITALQAGKTIEAKDDHIAFEKSKGEMLAKENKSLEKWNYFLRTVAGCAIFVAGVEIIKDLR